MPQAVTGFVGVPAMPVFLAAGCVALTWLALAFAWFREPRTRLTVHAAHTLLSGLLIAVLSVRYVDATVLWLLTFGPGGAVACGRLLVGLAARRR